jgi:hypothetical protein
MKKYALILIAIGLLTGGPAQAALFEFDNITNNNAGDAAIGEAQLSVEITHAGSDQVLFTFLNSGPEASSITDVYFDDGSLLTFDYLIDADDNGGGPGVDFSQGASPSNLPGANNASPPFVTPAGLSFGSDPPTQPNGVNPGESLGILFDILSGSTFDGVIYSIESADLRIGIHVQGFSSGGSESFVNDPNPKPTPEPATMLLLGSGLVGLAGFGRKKFFKKS